MTIKTVWENEENNKGGKEKWTSKKERRKERITETMRQENCCSIISPVFLHVGTFGNTLHQGRGSPSQKGQMRTRDCVRAHEGDVCTCAVQILFLWEVVKKKKASYPQNGPHCDLMPHLVSHYRQRGIRYWMKPVKSQPDAYAFQIKTIWKDFNGTDLIQITRKVWR